MDTLLSGFGNKIAMKANGGLNHSINMIRNKNSPKHIQNPVSETKVVFNSQEREDREKCKNA